MNLENIGYTPNNDKYLTIQQVDNLEPFLMNIVSDGEHGYLPAVMEHLPPAGAIQIKVYSP